MEKKKNIIYNRSTLSFVPSCQQNKPKHIECENVEEKKNIIYNKSALSLVSSCQDNELKYFEYENIENKNENMYSNDIKYTLNNNENNNNNKGIMSYINKELLLGVFNQHKSKIESFLYCLYKNKDCDIEKLNNIYQDQEILFIVDTNNNNIYINTCIKEKIHNSNKKHDFCKKKNDQFRELFHISFHLAYEGKMHIKYGYYDPVSIFVKKNTDNTNIFVYDDEKRLIEINNDIKNIYNDISVYEVIHNLERIFDHFPEVIYESNENKKNGGGKRFNDLLYDYILSIFNVIVQILFKKNIGESNKNLLKRELKIDNDNEKKIMELLKNMKSNDNIQNISLNKNVTNDHISKISFIDKTEENMYKRKYMKYKNKYISIKYN